MRSLLILMIGFVICQAAFSQEPVEVERSRNKVIIEDKVYYVHVVLPGQTLYSISKAYNISQKEIAIENPGVLSGIQVGQALKIPVEGMPAEVDTTEEIFVAEEGTQVHVIREGETLYSISKLYDVPVDSILYHNRDLDITEMQIGDKLAIPVYAEKEADQPVFNEEGYIYHKVRRRETLYSISSYYNVTIEDIRQANPELGWGSPRNGQVIRIPKPQIIDNEIIAIDTIPTDSALILEPDTILEDYNYRELYFEDYRSRKTYKVAFLMPFNLSEPEPLDSLLKDIKSQTQRNRITERYRMDQAMPKSINFLEFFEGALMAVDSIRETGMNLDVRFYDTKRSISKTNRILEIEDMDEMDLIIGPFYSFILEPVSDFCKENNIPLITPFYSDYDYLKYNPYLFQITSSYQLETQKMVKYLSKNFDRNIILVHNGDSLEMDRVNYFKDLLFKEFRDYAEVDDVRMKEVILDNSAGMELVHSLSTDQKNLVVVPTGDEGLASRVVSSLYFHLKDYDIEVLGTSYWPEYSSIDIRYFHDLQLTISHPGIISYKDSQILRFLSDFRSSYYAEPVEKTRNGSYYAFMGYDITMYFLSAIRQYGPRFILKLDSFDQELLLCNYRFSRITSYGGYENENLKYYRFDREMNIVEITLPEDSIQNELILEPLEDERTPSYLYIDRKRPKR